MDNNIKRKNRRSWKISKNTKSKRSPENETITSGSNGRVINKKLGNQEKILRIVQKHFVTEKEEEVMEEISQWVAVLEDYVKKGRPSEKSENKLVETVIRNQETIRNMNTYHDQETQTEGGGSVENLSTSPQDNSSINSLYPPGHWGME